ncbi:MAG: hypothetical protein HQL10_09185 [Nitrospirae bacterium]|nr:hypothetical protein [Nitrospirota bacterium]
MGFFSKLFGGGAEKEYPALDAASSAGQSLEKFRPQLETLIKKIDDKYEVVPSAKALYTFLGNPPGMFGMVWFLENDPAEHNMKSLMAKKGFGQKKIDTIMIKLREAYTEAEAEARFSAEAAGKKIIVIPSEVLAEKLYKILHTMDE